MKKNIHLILATVLFTQFGCNCLFAQNSSTSSKWDNQAYIGNKISGGLNKWKFSTELQVRLEDNLQALDNWFIEGIVSYLYNEEWEFVPDFRFSVYPNKVEYRPGLGALYKFIIEDEYQFVNQLKWQIDINPQGNSNNGLRYAVFINHKISDDIITNFAAGAFYRWRPDFTGFQYLRFGPGITYIFDEKHTLNFNYLISATNNTQTWEWAGIAVVQLVINITAKYKYLPAKYYDF